MKRPQSRQYSRFSGTRLPIQTVGVWLSFYVQHISRVSLRLSVNIYSVSLSDASFWYTDGNIANNYG